MRSFSIKKSEILEIKGKNYCFFSEDRDIVAFQESLTTDWRQDGLEMPRPPRLAIYSTASKLNRLVMSEWKDDEELARAIGREPGSTKFYEEVSDIRLYNGLQGKPNARSVTKLGMALGSCPTINDLREAVCSPVSYQETWKLIGLDPFTNWRTFLCKDTKEPHITSVIESFQVACSITGVMKSGGVLDADEARRLSASLATGLTSEPCEPAGSEELGISSSNTTASSGLVTSKSVLYQSQPLGIEITESSQFTQDEPFDPLREMLLGCPELFTPGKLAGWGVNISFYRQLSVREAEYAWLLLEKWVNQRVVRRAMTLEKAKW